MKRISSGTVTVIVLAIVVGLVAAFVVKTALQPKPQPVVEAPKTPTVPVVVASKNLTENSFIRRGDVRVIQVPAKAKREGTLRLAEIALGRIVKADIKAGQPVLEDNLYGIGDTLPGLDTRIPAGLRAIPIHVDEQSTVAKMVNLGSRVDISLTVEGSHPDLGELTTKTLLHGVEVISVDKPSTRRTGSTSKDATITVAVTPADANMLINAEGTGTLNLTLVSNADAGEHPVSLDGPDHKITRRDLLGLSPIPPAPKPYTIEKWEGGNVKVLKVSQDHIEEAQRATASSKKFNGQQTVPVSVETTGVVKPADAPADDLIDVSTPDQN